MRKILKLLSLTLLLASCAGEASSESGNLTVTIEDANGRKVEVTPGSYEHVVCIGAGALRLYSYLGDLSLLAGVEDIDNPSLETRPAMFDKAARPYLIAGEETFKTLPSCGKGGPQNQRAEAEKILSCHPDIVISAYEDIDQANSLQSTLSLPVLTVRYGDQGVFDESFRISLAMLGKVFGKEERATELISYVDACKEEISSATAEVESKPKAYIGGLGFWGVTDYLYTSNTYPCFTVANIENVASSYGLAKTGVQKLEKETFLTISKETDVMILDSAAIDNIKAEYKEDPTIFEDSKAFQSGEIYLQLAYNAYYTNLELMLANTYFAAKCVYPSLFEDLDMNEKLNEITSKFLGKELASEINAYPCSYGGYQKIDKETFFQ